MRGRARDLVVDPTADDDGDGLTNEEEEALGTDPDEEDSDGDGMSDTEEFSHGTDPTQGIDPMTEENLQAMGAARDQRGRVDELEKSILEEINPGGWKSFLLGDAAESLTLDENGELVLVPPGAMVYVRGREAEDLPDDGERGRRRPREGPGEDPRRGRQERQHGPQERAGEAVAQPPRPPGGAGLLKGVDGAAETKALPRFEPGRWLKHFDDHAAEFGYRTPVEYLRGARDFVARKDVETFTRVGGRTDGDRLFYDEASNTFAVLRKDGVLRTYFRPRDGRAYWLKQIGQG